VQQEFKVIKVQPGSKEDKALLVSLEPRATKVILVPLGPLDHRDNRVSKDLRDSLAIRGLQDKRARKDKLEVLARLELLELPETRE